MLEKLEDSIETTIRNGGSEGDLFAYLPELTLSELSFLLLPPECCCNRPQCLDSEIQPDLAPGHLIHLALSGVALQFPTYKSPAGRKCAIFLFWRQGLGLTVWWRLTVTLLPRVKGRAR